MSDNSHGRYEQEELETIIRGGKEHSRQGQFPLKSIRLIAQN